MMLTVKQIINATMKTKGLCFYCGNPAETIDHYIPKADKGGDTSDNLFPSCIRCNNLKGRRTIEHFRELLARKVNGMPKFTADHEDFPEKHNIKLPKFEYAFWFETQDKDFFKE